MSECVRECVGELRTPPLETPLAAPHSNKQVHGDVTNDVIIWEVTSGILTQAGRQCVHGHVLQERACATPAGNGAGQLQKERALARVVHFRFVGKLSLALRIRRVRVRLRERRRHERRFAVHDQDVVVLVENVLFVFTEIVVFVVGERLVFRV